MSFPKAKNKRFNEIMSCAPPVGSYDPKTLEKCPAALIDSKDERFKEPKPVDAHASNLFSSSIASSHSFRASTPNKLSAASSTDSLASDQCVSGIPKRATSSANIMAPADLAKQKELERQIRLLVQERNELHRRVQSKDEELRRTDNRLQQALKDRTSMTADQAAMEKELADLRKGNEILKTKELNVDRLRQLQTEIGHLQEKLKKKEKEVADMHEKLNCERAEKNTAIAALKQTNAKLADLNKELRKEVDDKSRQLRLLVGNSNTYEAEMDALKKEISQMKSRNQKFVEEEATLVAQCDRMQLVFSHCLTLQEQLENLVEGIAQQMHDSSTKPSEEIRVQLELGIGLLRTSMESCHLQKMDAENVTGDLKLKVHELIEAVVTDVRCTESVRLDLLTLFSKLIKSQQNEEELAQSVSTSSEKIKELQGNLGLVTRNKEELQKLYEEALVSLRMEKERCEEIQSTALGLLSERTSLESQLRNEKELSIGLEEGIRSSEAKMLQLSETVLSLEKQIHCSNGEKEDLLRQNVARETELKSAAEEQDRLENELKQLSEVIELKDAAYQQLEDERNKLATKLEAVEAQWELGQIDMKESCEKLKSFKLRYEIIESQLSEVNQETTAARYELVEELNETKNLVSSLQKQLDDCEVKLADKLNSLVKIRSLEEFRNHAQEQMTLLQRKNEELQQSHQRSLKSVADEQLRLSSRLETMSERKKDLELEVVKCHELIKSRNNEFETMSIQVKDLKRSEVLAEKLKERCHLLETNSAKELERLRQKVDEERRQVADERQRQQVMQKEYADRLQVQLDTKTRELNEANDRIRRQQRTLDQYSDQLTEMSQQHQRETTDLKGMLEQKSQQHGDVALITEEAQRWKAMYEDLWNKVQPFKEQLEAFELEKQLLLGRSKNAQMEIEKLSHNYAKILGHQNQKQKIHHILKLKEENVALKKEVEMLRDKECKNKRQIGHLTEKLDALEGKRRFDPSKAFKAGSDLPVVLPLREGNR